MARGFLTLFFSLLFCTSSLFAQQQIQGSVNARANRTPLAGINIKVKDTNIGVSTDKNGQYKIDNMPEGKSELIFSIIDMKRETRHVALGKSESKTQNVCMEEDNLQLRGVEANIYDCTAKALDLPRTNGYSCAISNVGNTVLFGLTTESNETGLFSYDRETNACSTAPIIST